MAPNNCALLTPTAEMLSTDAARLSLSESSDRSMKRFMSHSSLTSSILTSDSSKDSRGERMSKQVRFCEYANWSYFDSDAACGSVAVPRMSPPLLKRRSSSSLTSLRASWERIVGRLSPSPAARDEDLDPMSKQQPNVESTVPDPTSAHHTPSPHGRYHQHAQIVRQPLRESPGRVFHRANTTFKEPTPSSPKPPPVRGDWGDLLSRSQTIS